MFPEVWKILLSTALLLHAGILERKHWRTTERQEKNATAFLEGVHFLVLAWEHPKHHAKDL